LLLLGEENTVMHEALEVAGVATGVYMAVIGTWPLLMLHSSVSCQWTHLLIGSIVTPVQQSSATGAQHHVADSAQALHGPQLTTALTEAVTAGSTALVLVLLDSVRTIVALCVQLAAVHAFAAAMMRQDSSAFRSTLRR
jgi:hypothetical protein